MGNSPMKNKKRNDGFIMLIVICILALIAIYMILLTSDANTFIFQSDRAYLEACRQNLIASALNWAEKNTDAAISPVELNTSGMGIKNAVLKVKVISVEKGKSQIEINASCSKARQRLSSVKKFTIETKL
jgi:hypothetical protein